MHNDDEVTARTAKVGVGYLVDFEKMSGSEMESDYLTLS